MRSVTRYLGLGPLVCVAMLGIGCDQGSKPPEQAAQPSDTPATSSERTETHPDQPTGVPQSGEVTQPVSPSSGQ